MNDRQITEVSFICRLLYLVVICSLREDVAKSLESMAIDVLESPFVNMIPKRKNNIKRRVLKIEERLVKPLHEKTSGTKIMLVIYFFIQDLLDKEYIDIDEESKMWSLITILLNMIDQDKDGFSKIEASAKKQAGKWLQELNKEGYFCYEVA